MSDIWLQSRYGYAIDLVDPTPQQVDFSEICYTLARINRFTGAADPSVSVAFHTMIVADLVDESLKPYALLHDMHEARTGDIATPAADALAEFGRQAGLGLGSYDGDLIVRRAIKEFKRRHDQAIHEAAGLKWPLTRDQESAIKLADVRALMTERRDFMRWPPKPWNAELEAVEPSPTIYREGHFGSTPRDVGGRLLAMCLDYLPAFRLMANQAA
ncbi:MAG TPA: hypothetical protein VEF90_17775 [Xanthobacteraceae bacterium]|nr:hypothetical protein [Xanthobacteraceae bacterium]